MTTVPCPRCGMPVGLDQEICSHCRTPRDDREMEEGRAFVRQEELRLKRRPKIIAAGVAAAAVLTVAWVLRGLVLGPIRVAWSEFQIEVEKTRQPGHWVKKPVYPTAAIAVAPPTPAQVAVSSFVYLNAVPPAIAHASPPPPPPAPAPAVVTRDAQPAILPPPAPAFPTRSKDPPSPGELYIQGLVYDLRTNDPVKHVAVRFEQPKGGSRWETRTNEDGRYWVSIFKDTPEDLVVTIEAPGYRKGLLEDKDPPYRERSPPARASLMAETVDSDLDPVPLRYKQGEQIIDLDLVLVPEVKR